MKHFKYFLSKSLTPEKLSWLFPVLLLIPNIALAITEQDPVLAKVTDIILPLGIYYTIIGLSTSVGLTVICSLPLMIFAAFQIVLLYLYGESIIAIDMFLNVVTTNTKEVSELLGNLIIAIFTVVIIYLPPIIWGSCLVYKHKKCNRSTTRQCLKTGIGMSAIGLLLMVSCYISIDQYSVRRDIFPVNVIANMIEAINRTIDTNNYSTTSTGYSFDARSTHPDSIKEVYVLVIGETSRADNWQIFGYKRQTNPRLSHRSNLIIFPKTLSESNTTHKSVPMLLSALTAATFGDSIYYTKSIEEAFNEAGYSTAFFSNQRRNHSFIDFFGQQAELADFIKDEKDDAYDFDLVSRLKQYISSAPSDKLFITLHCYGSHFNYRERYKDDARIFTPDNATEATSENRQQLVNAYDNTIVYTDALLDEIISQLEQLHIPTALVYTSDHGEDIFDDERQRFLHASPTPTFNQIHVPLIIWTSSEYNDIFSDNVNAAEANQNKNVSSSRSVFNTMLSLSGVKSSKYDYKADLCSPSYSETPRIYLNDYNEAVSLLKAGFRNQDIKISKTHNIAI